MRIISGKYKSRRINSALPSKENCLSSSGTDLRPTTDRARESLFNILNNIIDFDSLKCLDLFAGTGSVGFELLSRGAEHVDFVELSAKQAKMIENTSAELDCTDNIKIYKQDVSLFLENRKDEIYDLIFADPPYSQTNTESWIDLLMKMNFTVLVFECGPLNKIILNKDGFDFIERKTGITNFKILVAAAEE